MQDARPLRRPPPPPGTSTALPGVNIADRWVNQLRRQAKESPASRDADALSTPKPLPPHIASTATGGPPSSSRSGGRQISQGNRSHSSLPPTSAHRHRDQLERVYDSHPRYDADFDRSLGMQPRASGSTAPPPPAAVASHKLYNPETNSTSASASRRVHGGGGGRGGPEDDAGSGRRAGERSRRDPVDVSDSGKGRESRDNLDSAVAATSDEPDATANGRTGSRSSKESKTRRKREERRRANEEGGDVSSIQSRELFDYRKDDPWKFTGTGGSTRKGANGDAKSFVSTSAASHVSGSDATGTQVADAIPAVPPNRADPTPFVTELKKAFREIAKLEADLQDEHKAALAASAREEEVGKGVRIQGGSKKYDDEYWVKLASRHKQLADAHYSFLQMALDPRHPASLHTLPQKYNIPTRLWQTGFHQLLERMRHAVVAPSPSADPNTNVLEHLVEFIQYAYGFYTQLSEDPTIHLFRAAWIEQLGDLARYRMAVAGLASRAAASHAQANGGHLFGTERGDEVPRNTRREDEASIGEAALGDWDLEEQETWRVMARDWYSQGVTETPGTGRLQHHLALLSKGDELRSLYHYSKSLTTSHPYLSARESILPLFEDELQARRSAPDVTKAELFVHLHGMLFTKISLDDFDDCFARFMERLREDAALVQHRGGDWFSLGSGTEGAFGDSEMIMLAVINIAALMQYGAEDGVLRRIIVRDSPATPAAHKVKTPQAIMLNPASIKRADGGHDSDDAEAIQPDSAGDVVKQLGATSENDNPLPFRIAQRLAFGMLDLMLQHPFRTVGEARVANPYVVILLTFLAHIAQQPSGLRHLERSLPWERLVAFFNSLSSTSEIRLDTQAKLAGPPLPEDWCIRGMEWTGRQLFGRGYWKTKSSGAGSSGRRDEMPAIGPSTPTFESEMDALKIDLDSLGDMPTDGDSEAPVIQLAVNRTRRLATVASWLAKAVPGLDLNQGRFVITGSLDVKLRRWKQEDQEAAEAERQSRITAWGGHEDEAELGEGEESDDEDDVDPSDTPAVRELKVRRRELKAVIKQARLATRKPQAGLRQLSGPRFKSQSARPRLSVFPGYTVLVFDTNIMLSSMKLFRELVEARQWTIVVPLAVVTELDGLKNNPTPLGIAAVEAVSYLEVAIRSHATHLKIQTSRGNYLKDLSIRSESIDFGGNAGEAGGFSGDFARSMDDVILRAVSWQQDHFASRLSIVNPRADRRQIPSDASTVVLITFDRNLRLKARARGLDAADEKDMSSLVENG